MLSWWKKIGRRQLPAFIACALALAISLQLAQTAFALRRALAPALPTIPAAGPLQFNKPDFSAGMTRVANAHLFGSAPVDQAPQAQIRAAAATEWVLSGTLAGHTPESGSAIIGLTAATTRLRAVGQEIANGFRLVQVLGDQVILEAQGQRVSVKMKRSGLPTASLAATLPGDRATLVSYVSYISTTSGRRTTDVADVPRGSTSEVAAAAWDARMSQGASAALALRPRPHRGRDGRYDGMEVTANAAADPGQLGLQASDVITRINGKAITSPVLAQEALSQITNGDPVTLTVERGGSERQVALNVPENGPAGPATTPGGG